MIGDILRILRNPHRKKSAKRKGASRKSREKGVRSLHAQVVEHEDKIRREPNSPVVPHWKREVEHFKAEIAAEELHRRRRR